MAAQSNEPWPPVQVLEPNPALAEMMLGNAGGHVSEMSAVAHYRYNRLATLAANPALSDTFHQISIVEMHHMDTFAHLALLLGADPRLWHRCTCGQGGRGAGQMKYWSPGYVDYRFRSLRDMAQKSLEEEQAAVQKYSAQLSRVGDPHVAAILRRVTQDEEEHAATFKEILAGEL